MTDQDEGEASPQPSYAREGAEAAQALAGRLSRVLDETDYPTKAGERAKQATQQLGLYLVTSEFLRSLPAPVALQFLGQLEAARFAGGQEAPATRTGRLRLTPTPKEPKQ